jgi:hypothetical protein
MRFSIFFRPREYRKYAFLTNMLRARDGEIDKILTKNAFADGA